MLHLSYARFAVSFCYIGLNFWMLTSGLYNFGDYIFHQTNLQEISNKHVPKGSSDIKVLIYFWRKWEMRLYMCCDLADHSELGSIDCEI